jgi:hypothetical protein
MDAGNENCVILDYYAASSGNFLPTFWENLAVPSSRDRSEESNRFSQNVGMKLPVLTAQ